jgi:antitoxin MazE
VRIGNSRGIRIPKPLIEQCGFGDTVELRVEQNRLIVAPDHAPRQGWREAFADAGSSTDDALLEALPPNEFDDSERLVRKLGTASAKTVQTVSSVLVEMFTR